MSQDNYHGSYDYQWSAMSFAPTRSREDIESRDKRREAEAELRALEDAEDEFLVE